MFTPDPGSKFSHPGYRVKKIPDPQHWTKPSVHLHFLLSTGAMQPKLKYCEIFFFVYFFGGLECVGHSIAYVAHL